jgi:tetratricopeptide (TPR) repeat protein
VPTVAQVFDLALQHLHAGNARQAEQLCKFILQASPGHADTHHLVGLIAYQTPARLDEAVACFQEALRLRPEFPEAHNNLGNVFFLQEKLEDAVIHYRQALVLNPDYAEAHNNLGLALVRNGKPEEALEHYRQALRLLPNSAEAHNNLGNAFLEGGNVPEAIQCFQHAVRLKPNYAKAYHNLGIALERQEKVDEALQSYRQALQLQPASAETLCNLGIILERKDQLDEAIRCYREALRVKPNFVEAYNNLGLALERQEKFDEAIRCYEQALQIKPDSAMACTNLGNVHWAMARYEKALALYEQALGWCPDSAETHFNRSRLRLLQGNWAEGWPEYEWRWKTKECPGYAFPQPRWDGSPLAGRTLLLLAEQGLGDTLHFIRYVPLVKQRGGHVIVECQPRLLRLLTSVEGIDLLLVQGSPLPDFDVHASLVSLPGILGTTLANVPAKVPYLHADIELVEYWRQELQTLRGFRIGVVWQGNPGFVGDRNRSIPLAHFAFLAQLEGVRLFSLQKGAGTEQLRDLADKFSILELGSRLDETTGAFMDTAAVMQNLDLVISSDTSVAHLAGALGVRVWVALSQVPDWRWMLQREDSPWYPTMRLFRQTRSGDWQDVFQRMAAEIKSLTLIGSSGHGHHG